MIYVRLLLLQKNLDFFRLEPGSIFKPAIADDTKLFKWAEDEMKVWHDPAEEDALVWARWGGAAFEQNQARHTCVNPYDSEYEATLSKEDKKVTFDEFNRIIDVNWPRDKHNNYNQQDVRAYFARMHTVLLTEGWIYFRLASTETLDVPRFPWPNSSKPDLFVPATTATMKQYKKDQSFKPADYDVKARWSLAVMRKLALGGDIKRTKTFIGNTLFQDRAAPRIEYDALSTQMPSELPGSRPSVLGCEPQEAAVHTEDLDDDDFEHDEEGAIAPVLVGEQPRFDNHESEEDPFNLGGSMNGPEVSEEPPRKASRVDDSAVTSHQQAAQSSSSSACAPPGAGDVPPVRVKIEPGMEPAVFKRLKNLRGLVLDIDDDSE